MSKELVNYDPLRVAEEHIRTALGALGYDVESEHMMETPRRVAAVWDRFKGLEPAPKITTFENSKVNQVIIANEISVSGLCPHHLLPWRGKACVAYIPNKKVAGISKLVRTAQWASRRAAIQEDVGNIIADLLQEELEPMGVAVVISALHDCVACRGAEDMGIAFTTSVMKGIFFLNPSTRAELLALIGGH